MRASRWPELVRRPLGPRLCSFRNLPLLSFFPWLLLQLSLIGSPQWAGLPAQLLCHCHGATWSTSASHLQQRSLDLLSALLQVAEARCVFLEVWRILDSCPAVSPDPIGLSSVSVRNFPLSPSSDLLCRSRQPPTKPRRVRVASTDTWS